MILYFHAGRSLSTAVYKAESDLGQAIREKTSEVEEEVRDSSPDLEVRQDVWSIMGDCIYRNHVAARTRSLFRRTISRYL